MKKLLLATVSILLAACATNNYGASPGRGLASVNDKIDVSNLSEIPVSVKKEPIAKSILSKIKNEDQNISLDGSIDISGASQSLKFASELIRPADYKMHNTQSSILEAKGIKKLIGQRINDSGDTREEILEAAVKLASKYWDFLQPDVKNNFLNTLELVTKYDYYSKIRRRSMLGFVTLALKNNEKERAKLLLNDVAKTDGDIVFDAYYPVQNRYNESRAKFRSSLDSNGERLYDSDYQWGFYPVVKEMSTWSTPDYFVDPLTDAYYRDGYAKGVGKRLKVISIEYKSFSIPSGTLSEQQASLAKELKIAEDMGKSITAEINNGDSKLRRDLALTENGTMAGLLQANENMCKGDSDQHYRTKWKCEHIQHDINKYLEAYKIGSIAELKDLVKSNIEKLKKNQSVLPVKILNNFLVREEKRSAKAKINADDYANEVTVSSSKKTKSLAQDLLSKINFNKPIGNYESEFNAAKRNNYF